jgi:hypothetical protein
MVDNKKYFLKDIGRRIGYSLENTGKAVLRSSLIFPKSTNNLRESLLSMVVASMSPLDPITLALKIACGEITRVDVPDEDYYFYPKLQGQPSDIDDLVRLGWLKECLEDPRAVSVFSKEEQQQAVQLMKFANMKLNYKKEVNQ